MPNALPVEVKDALNDAASTLAALQIIGEKKVCHAGEAFELLEMVEHYFNGKPMTERHRTNMKSGIRVLLAKVTPSK